MSHRVVSKMYSSRRAGFLLTFLMVISAFSPLISTASATGPVELSLSDQHLLMSPGTTANVTITVHNNDTQINDYTLEINPDYDSAWNINLVDSVLEDVLPTYYRSTTAIVTLNSLALLSNQTSVEFIVNQSGSNANASIDLTLSIQPHYEASLNTGNVGIGGLILVNPGTTVDVDIDVMNLGNMNDTILLDVVDEPDLIQWWDDYNSGQSEPTINGNETITLIEPLMNSEFDVAQEDVEIKTNASGLTPNLAYDLDIEAIDENGVSLNSWSAVFNSTTGLDSFNTVWPTSDEGNVTIWSNVSFNGSILSSDFSEICLYDTYGCSVVAQYALMEGTITGNGNLSYVFNSNGTAYIPGTSVDEGTLIEVTATADANWSFTEFTGDSNSTTSPVVIELDADKTIGALFEENQTVVLNPQIVVNVITNSTHMFSTFELTNLTQGDDYYILFEIETNDTIPIPVDVGWDNFTASMTNLSRHYNATYGNDSYCIEVSLSKNSAILDTDSVCFEIPSGTSTTMAINMEKSTSNLPTGWAVYWINDVYSNMSPMTSENAVLRIIIPNGTAPGYIGIRLWAASTQGNVSMSTVIVIQVGAQDSIALVDATNHTWLPDQSADAILEVTNTGNRAVGYDYSTDSSTGPCDVVVSSVGSTLEVGGMEQASVNVRPWEVAHRNDTCEFDFIATNRLNGETTTYPIQIRIGVSWGLEIYSPQLEALKSGEITTVTFTIKNLGTEQDDYRVEVETPLGIMATAPPGWLTITRGQTDTVNIDFELGEDSNLSGTKQVTIKLIGLNGAEAQVDYHLEVEGNSAFELIGPQDSRLIMDADSSAELLIDISNTGTQINNYELQTVSGLPSCIILNGTTSDLSQAEQNSVRELAINFQANSNCPSGDHVVMVSVEELGSGIVEQINITIQVTSVGNVDISASSTSPVVGEKNFEMLTLTVTNLGSDATTFEITVTDSSGFDISLESSILSLESGEQKDVNLGIKRTTAVGIIEVTISVVDTSKSSVSDYVVITALSPVQAAELIIQVPNNILSSGDALSGSLLISNQGNLNDNFSISSNGLLCVLESHVEVESQQSATIPFSCEVPLSVDAGAYIITFTVTSGNDISKQTSETLQYQVSSNYMSGADIVDISISQTSLSMNYDGSGTIAVTVSNLLNEEVNGTLSVEGSDTGSFEFTWEGYIDGALYELSPNSQMSFELNIKPKTDAAIVTEFTIVGISQVESGSNSDSSQKLSVAVEGLRKAPDGVDLMFGELDGKQTLIGLFSGWGIIVLAIVLRIRKFKNRGKQTLQEPIPLDNLPPLGDLPPMEELPPPVLDLPELPAIDQTTPIESTTAKLESDGTVRCNGCNAKLRTPSDKSPPFRFTCPKCSEIVRVS